jgi:hypothetical protein
MPLKPKAAVTFDGDDGTSGPDSDGDRIAEPDAHQPRVPQSRRLRGSYIPRMF